MKKKETYYDKLTLSDIRRATQDASFGYRKFLLFYGFSIGIKILKRSYTREKLKDECFGMSQYYQQKGKYKRVAYINRLEGKLMKLTNNL